MRIVHGLPMSCRLDGKLHPRQSTLRRMGTEVVQGLQHKHHVKLPLTPSSKLMTGQISKGRPVDSSERRRFLISRKDYDACPCGKITPFFFIVQKAPNSLPLLLLYLLHLALVLVMLAFYKVISVFLLGSVVDV